MVWFLVDDNLGEHPKVDDAGLAAMGLWVICGSYCARYPQTEGFVPESYVRSKKGLKLARKLVESGLWKAAIRNGKPGWQFHEWHLNGQRTKEQVEHDKALARERQRRFRRGRADNDGASNGVSNGVTARDGDGVTNGNAVTALATVPKPSQAITKELTPPTPPQNGRGENPPPPHKHEPNTIRALEALVKDRSLPITVNELLVHAYRLGCGDPWEGYLAVKVVTNFQLDTARDPGAALRARLNTPRTPAAEVS